MARHWILLGFVALLATTAFAQEEADSAKDEEVQSKIQSLLEAMNRKFDTAFAGVAADSIHIELPPDRRWTGAGAVASYISEMSIAKMRVKSTSPINVSGGSVAFKKEVSGTFKNGCDFYAADVVQVMQFDEHTGQLTTYTEYFPRNDFFRQQTCAKAKKATKPKDEL